MAPSTFVEASRHAGRELVALDQHRHELSEEHDEQQWRRDSAALAQDAISAAQGGACTRPRRAGCRRPTRLRASSHWPALLMLLLAARLAQAFPSGAPEQACKDLKPGHGVEPQSGAVPFELAQDKLQVGAGEQIKGESGSFQLGASVCARPNERPHQRPSSTNKFT